MAYPSILTTKDAEMINTALNMLLKGLECGALDLADDSISKDETIGYIKDLISRMTY